MVANQILVDLIHILHLVFLLSIYPILWAIALIKSVWRLGQKTEDISGQVAVVTGSAQGLGRELAMELAKRGCHIALVDIQHDLARTTAKFISELYKVKTKAYKVDISDSRQLVDFHAQVTEDFGDVTILINNAGIIPLTDSNYVDINEVQNVVNVNFTSHIWTNQLFLPRMKELNRGYNVAISSFSALYPMPILQIYSPTKSAIRSYMSSLRIDLKSENFKIQLTTVMPTMLSTHQPPKDVVYSPLLKWLYPPIEANVVAGQVVESMLQGVEELPIPRVLGIIYKLLELLPTCIKDVFPSLLKPNLHNVKSDYFCSYNIKDK